MKRVVVIGGGVIGLSAAAECARRGHRVTVIERARARRGASLGNARMVVPSHFIPMAAPGMVALGLKWMWNPESPFYIAPRLDPALALWAWRFWRASTRERVERGRADFLYLSTTGYMQHKHAPEDAEALDFYAAIDAELGKLLALGAVLGVTADHGMNAKQQADGSPNVIYLESELTAALELVQTRLAEPPGVEELAALCGLSPHHFGHLVQRLFHLTPLKLILKIRRLHAAGF